MAEGIRLEDAEVQGPHVATQGIALAIEGQQFLKIRPRPCQRRQPHHPAVLKLPPYEVDKLGKWRRTDAARVRSSCEGRHRQALVFRLHYLLHCRRYWLNPLVCLQPTPTV